MKPLPENHFTIEDWDVIVDVVLRCGRVVDGSMLGYWVMERSKQSDRRDAELMFRIELCRQWERDHPEEFASYLGWGWVHATCIGFAGSDITYFA